MSVVVTGASGQLGSLIVRSLLERGAEPGSVVATGRDTSRLEDLVALGVRTARLDYDDPSSATEALAEGDVLVLVSGSEMGKRVEQHTGIIRAAQDAGAARVVYTSAPQATTSDLVVNPEHKATEEFLTASGVAFTILRNGWYTENYAADVAAGRETGEIVGSAGDGRVASASRADYAEGAAVVALDDAFAGRVLELSGDTAWTHEEFAATLAAVSGSPVRYVDVPMEELVERLVAAGTPEPAARFRAIVEQNTRDGLLGLVTGELSDVLGRPTTPIAETMGTL